MQGCIEGYIEGPWGVYWNMLRNVKTIVWYTVLQDLLELQWCQDALVLLLENGLICIECFRTCKDVIIVIGDVRNDVLDVLRFFRMHMWCMESYYALGNCMLNVLYIHRKHWAWILDVLGCICRHCSHLQVWRSFPVSHALSASAPLSRLKISTLSTISELGGANFWKISTY